MNTYTRPQVAALFEVSPETVRQWTAHFAAHLSQLATPTKGLKRQYTADDMRVISLIANMAAAGKLYADIEAALANGQRGQLPDTGLTAPVAGRLETALTELENTRKALTDALADSQRRAGQVELLERQLAAANAEINRLNRALGKLE